MFSSNTVVRRYMLAVFYMFLMASEILPGGFDGERGVLSP